MEAICEDNKCTGCMACKASCNHEAITVSYDEMGFRKPKIKQENCTNCGLCKKICPSNNSPKLNPSLDCFAAVAKDKDLLRTTSSGGIATLITKYFIREGGIVYGCTGENIRAVQHIRITKEEELNKLKGSKYVQSDIMNVYGDVRKDLLEGRKVLFIGVSCQIAGIRKFLSKEFSNFYTADLICHGASSQYVLNENLDYYKNKYKINEITDVKFRRKSLDSEGQSRIEYGIYFKAHNRDFSFVGIKDPFMLGYMNNQIFRDSCYQCQYADLYRVSDLTIGDFWGLGDDCKLKNEMGVSVCIRHSEKGQYLLDLINTNAVIVPRSLIEATKGNPQLKRPTTIPSSISEFRELHNHYGLVKAVTTINRRQLWKSKIYSWCNRLGVVYIARLIKKLCRI